ncbi:hypothetical protein BD410DRAFT_846297 [Rickenella mellea]|uniref:Uncharacterized protein n=1 Tax=Rickenella mellea TaxID=50990 RepID=A0A4Y7PGH6_9AGAM|nr:hypothetical protein BD410DRAFT_846297 [Rickenella mellea]
MCEQCAGGSQGTCPNDEDGGPGSESMLRLQVRSLRRVMDPGYMSLDNGGGMRSAALNDSRSPKDELPNSIMSHISGPGVTEESAPPKRSPIDDGMNLDADFECGQRRRSHEGGGFLDALLLFY